MVRVLPETRSASGMCPRCDSRGDIAGTVWRQPGASVAGMTPPPSPHSDSTAHSDSGAGARPADRAAARPVVPTRDRAEAGQEPAAGSDVTGPPTSNSPARRSCARCARRRSYQPRRRYPTAVLLTYLARRRVTSGDLAHRAGKSTPWVERALTAATLSEGTADLLAVRLGRHPCELWPSGSPTPPARRRITELTAWHLM